MNAVTKPHHLASPTSLRSRSTALLAGALIGLGALAPAQASEALAGQKACLACHQVSKPVVGPSFVDIAKKYKGDKKAVDKLAAKVRKGGGGVWNMPMGPMPAQGQVSEAEAKQIVSWILTLK